MKSILIIEDTSAIREEICEFLELEGFKVYEAENGKIGLEIAKCHMPDIIVSDILMPELDGFELFDELAKDVNTKLIPVIFLSARANKKSIKKGLKMGAKKYITKPVSPDILLNAINDKLSIKVL